MKRNQKYISQSKPWEPGKPAKYITQLTRKQTSTIYKTRTRMLQVKNNYPSAHNDLTCRACKKTTETQEHVLQECTILHNSTLHITNNSEIFTDDIETLRHATFKIQHTLDNLKKFV